MRLKSGYISQYKNLKDFTLSFDGSSFIDIFHIFHHFCIDSAKAAFDLATERRTRSICDS